MILGWIEQRLEATEAFNEVAGAAGLAAVKSGQTRTPGAYAYQLRSVATAPFDVNDLAQDVLLAFGIAIVVDNLRDDLGKDSTIVLEEFKDTVKKALFGQRPDGEEDALIYQGGSLIQINSEHNQLIWQEIYTIETCHQIDIG